MTHVRSICAHILFCCIALSIVLSAGTMAMSHGIDRTGAVPSESMDDHAHDGHAMMPQGMDCPGHEPSLGMSADGGHDDHDRLCAVTACCYAADQAIRLDAPATLLAPTLHAPFADLRLTQAEPERAKKPPRHA